MTVEVKDNSKEFVRSLEEAKKSALKQMGLLGSADAASIAPVDTGELRRSISYTVEGDSVHIGAAAKHGPHVELGTSRQKAQPYIRPSIHNNASKFRDIVEQEMKKVVK